MNIFNICGPDGATADQVHQDGEISKFLKTEKTKMSKEIKLLLLGTGDSGKSTIAKQMKIIYLQSFTDEERNKWKIIIHFNVISYIKLLIQQMEKFGLDFHIPDPNRAYAEKYLAIPELLEQSHLTQEMGREVQSLWKDVSIQETWKRNEEFQISDSAPYFLDKVDEVCSVDFTPSDEDVLRSRVKTTGIAEVSFLIETELYKMVDVGGQRSERKKWIHCFQDVTAIIFVVALSEYNLKLEENDTVNRMEESLKLFDDIINNVWFRNTNIILFLNKLDLFEEKFPKSPITVCFPDYNGNPGDIDSAKKFIAGEYICRNRNASREVF